MELFKRKIKPKFITVKETREIMRRGDQMPTAIFSANKTDYIVKPRTIFGTSKRNKKGGIH
jgi:hypothetical protein